MFVNIELQSAEVCRRIPGGFFADFGKAAFGRLEVVVKTSQAATAEICIGEVLDADGRIERTPGGNRCFKSMSKELRAGENRFFMEIKKHRSPYSNGFQRSKALTPENAGGEIAPYRYAEVTGENIESVDFIRHAVFGEFDDKAAHFESSDSNLNKVWDFCKYSVKATSCFGIYVDGERERQVFEGDTYVGALGAYCCGGGYEIAQRTLGFSIKYYPQPVLEYRLMGPRLVRDYMLYSGDEVSLQVWKKYLPELLCARYLNSDGLLENPQFIGDDPEHYSRKMPYEFLPLFQDDMQFLVDWPAVERDNYDYGAVNFISNAFYCDALRNLELLMPGNGYGKTALDVQEKIHKYFRRSNGMFVDNTASEHTALHTAVFALALDIAEKQDVGVLSDFMVKKGMACSVYVAQFLLDACFKNNKAQYAIDLMRSESERSWLNMISQGSTITMEAWSNACKPNQDWNHVWGAAPANVIPRRLVGIRPVRVGFKEFTVDPQPGDIKEFIMRHPSPQGEIKAEYSNNTLQLTVPGDATAICRNRSYTAGVHTIKL